MLSVGLISEKNLHRYMTSVVAINSNNGNNSSASVFHIMTAFCLLVL